MNLAHQVGLGLTYEHLRSVDKAAEGNQGTVTAFYLYDDRLSPFWSYEGKGLALRASSTLSEDSPWGKLFVFTGRCGGSSISHRLKSSGGPLWGDPPDQGARSW
ncbi:MAG: hypothetical protein R3C68_07895 [Myxococcota bacterium]